MLNVHLIDHDNASPRGLKFPCIYDNKGIVTINDDSEEEKAVNQWSFNIRMTPKLHLT